MREHLPDDVADDVRASLADAMGCAVELVAARPATGGCIHHSLAVDTTGGPVFLKWNRGSDGAGFTAEARALAVLRRAADADGLLAIPRVLAVQDAAGDAPGWLALEYLPPSPRPVGYGRRLGEGLARLHRQGVSDLTDGLPEALASLARHGDPVPLPPADAFGWFEENRIGPLDQRNPWTADWATFWREARLRPQIEGAFVEGALRPEDRSWSDPLLEAVEAALEPVSGMEPELVHGDLWSGNVHPGPDGRPVLVDPAAYLGRGEVDLAMARLFGGFVAETFERYHTVNPAVPGFEEVRLPLYQLYYLLVHVRLFGPSYLAGTRGAARSVLQALG